MSELCAWAFRRLDARLTFFWLLGFGLVVRLITLAFFARLPLISDAQAYHAMALQLLHNESFAPILPPGLPYYLALFYALFGPGESIGRASMLLFYVASSALLYLVVKRYSCRQAANIAVLIFALYPSYVYGAVAPYTQLTVATCLLGIVLLGALALNASRKIMPHV